MQKQVNAFIRICNKPIKTEIKVKFIDQSTDNCLVITVIRTKRKTNHRVYNTNKK